MTQTSAAAMRAAQALFPNMRPRDDTKIIATAAIIDREIAPLREALRELDRSARAVMQHMPIGWHTDPKNFAVRDRLAAALEESVNCELGDQ